MAALVRYTRALVRYTRAGRRGRRSSCSETIETSSQVTLISSQRPRNHQVTLAVISSRQAELFFAAQEERVRREVASLAAEEMRRWRRAAGAAEPADKAVKAGDKAGDKAGAKAENKLDKAPESLAARLMRDGNALKVARMLLGGETELRERERDRDIYI